MTATLSGFKSGVRDNVRLDIGSRPTVDFRLQLLSVSESVTVTAAPAIVESSRTDGLHDDADRAAEDPPA